MSIERKAYMKNYYETHKESLQKKSLQKYYVKKTNPNYQPKFRKKKGIPLIIKRGKFIISFS